MFVEEQNIYLGRLGKAYTYIQDYHPFMTNEFIRFISTFMFIKIIFIDNALTKSNL